MITLRTLGFGIAMVSGSLAQASPPGTLPEAPPTDVQITGSTNDPAVTQGLSGERVSAQARYMFTELDADDSGDLLPGDVPDDSPLSTRFVEFDFDGDGRIGLAEFEAYFSTQHYRQDGDRWFPRVASTGSDGDYDPALEADATAAADDERD